MTRRRIYEARADPGLLNGGGGGKDYASTVHITSAKGEIPYLRPGSRARIRALEALGF